MGRMVAGLYIASPMCMYTVITEVGEGLVREPLACWTGAIHLYKTGSP